MTIVLFYQDLRTGGIQTLIMRLSDWLVRHGHSVTLILLRGGELEEGINKKIDIVFLDNCLTKLNQNFFGTYYPHLLDRKYDVFYCFDFLSFIIGAQFYREYSQRTCFCVGSFFPNDIGINITNITLRQKHNKNITNLLQYFYNEILDHDSKTFMNMSVRKSIESDFGSIYTNSNILPIPIYQYPERPFNKIDFEKKKIISIGRLEKFKTYNLYMLDIIQKLKHKGIYAEWHVYGKGELEREIKEQIKKRDLSNRVFLHGQIKYNDFYNVLEDAIVFVGMGTSLIEAGSIGVPCVPAIVNYGPFSYGYLYNLPLYQTGELLDSRPTIPIIDLLEKVFSLKIEEYIVDCRKSIQHANHFDIDILAKRYLNIWQNCGFSEKLLELDQKSFFDITESVKPILRRISITNWVYTHVPVRFYNKIQSYYHCLVNSAKL